MTPDSSIDLPAPDDATGTPETGRRALEESQRATARSNAIIEGAAATLNAVRELHEENHYAEKFRAIIRGTHRHA